MDQYVRQYKEGLASLSSGDGFGFASRGTSNVRESFLSDASLEHAEIRHAARVPLPKYSIPTTSREQPYYSKVIEPNTKLGDLWNGAIRRPSSTGIIDDMRWLPKRSPLCAATIWLEETYTRCNAHFSYSSKSNPQRVLTKPSKPAKNDGHDNEDCDYILKVNEILGDEKGCQFRVISLLGQGTFGQVVKCEQVSTGNLFSVKVIKNKPAYRKQSLMEVEILKKLNDDLDPENKHHIVRLVHQFDHKNHLCLVFELLSYNLYELIKQNGHRGLSIHIVRILALQLLDTLAVLKDGSIIHCDLKPENILLIGTDASVVKVIDFGSACHESHRMYTYIQSRFYRSPEVLLGLPYTGAIDMWSLGCIVAEMTIGLPLFPGSSEFNQLHRVVDMLGIPPANMLNKKESNVGDYFISKVNERGETVYELKMGDPYGNDRQRGEQSFKRYFPGKTLTEVIRHARKAKDNQQGYKDERSERVEALIDFLQRLLEIDPVRRWTPQQALQHPFITGKPFTAGQIPSSPLLPVDGAQQRQHQRQRARSMNTPLLPKQMQALANDMNESPILERQPILVDPTATTASKTPYHVSPSRSQGNLYSYYQNIANAGPSYGMVGIRHADGSTSKDVHKVKIAPQVKVRYGSHETFQSTNDDSKKTNFNMNSLNAGEAAGGIMMMGQTTSKKIPLWSIVDDAKRGRRK